MVLGICIELRSLFSAIASSTSRREENGVTLPISRINDNSPSSTPLRRLSHSVRLRVERTELSRCVYCGVENC
jgi:hypothetical protein